MFSLMKSFKQHLILPVALTAFACSESGTDSLPPVDATEPTKDRTILNDEGLMSDGSVIIPHTTTTVETSIDIISTGVIGGLSVDKDGNIYNANFHTSVWRTTPAGETTLLSDAFNAASGNLALDNGDLLQADFSENKIYRIRADGSRSIFSEEGLDGPVGLVRHPEGSFVIANYRGKFLARVAAEGGKAETVLTDERLQGPNGVTIDPAGNIYIADLESNIVFKWTPEGELQELAELPGDGNAHNIYANGALYVNKIWDHVVYRVELDTGTYGIVSGNGQAGYTDGPTGTATIEEPNGIGATHDGQTVYVNTHRGEMFGDQGLIIIRKLQVVR